MIFAAYYANLSCRSMKLFMRDELTLRGDRAVGAGLVISKNNSGI